MQRFQKNVNSQIGIFSLCRTQGYASRNPNPHRLALILNFEFKQISDELLHGDKQELCEETVLGRTGALKPQTGMKESMQKDKTLIIEERRTMEL